MLYPAVFWSLFSRFNCRMRHCKLKRCQVKVTAHDLQQVRRLRVRRQMFSVQMNRNVCLTSDKNSSRRSDAQLNAAASDYWQWAKFFVTIATAAIIIIVMGSEHVSGKLWRLMCPLVNPRMIDARTVAIFTSKRNPKHLQKKIRVQLSFCLSQTWQS